MVFPILAILAGASLGAFAAYKMLSPEDQEKVDKLVAVILRKKYGIDVEGVDTEDLKKDPEKKKVINDATKEAIEQVKKEKKEQKQ